MAENIAGYKYLVKHLEFAMAVRKTPAQYIGYTGTPGHINMGREIFQNGTDEQERKLSPCNWVRFEFYEKDLRIKISDNGRGLPHSKMYEIYTNSNTSTNYEKELYDYTSGRHGVGAKATMALSADFCATSYICKEVSGRAYAHQIRFHEGEVWDESDFDLPDGSPSYEKEIPNKDNFQGSVVEFTPSIEIMGEITTTCEDFMNLIVSILPLMKIGSVVEFYGVKANGEVIDKRLVNEDGIMSILVCSSKSPIILPINISEDNGTMKTNISFTYDLDNLGEEKIQSFANMCPTLNTNNSTHVKAFLDTLSLVFRKYMNNIYLGNKSKLKIVDQDIKSGLNAVVSVAHLYPHFSGQAKEIFGNKDIIPFIKNAMLTQIDEWMKNNASDLQKICKHFKDVADLRVKGEKDTASFKLKHSSGLDGLPAKCERATGKCKKLEEELALVEGDSAMGGARKARCPNRQWLFPLRGKPLNAMTTSKAEFFKNEEAKAIRHILDAGEGKDFDITRCRFGKVIFLGDADVDGLHIRELLLKMFLIYFRPLIEAGRVYAAQPPLYGTVINKKQVYFTDMKEYISFLMDSFYKQNTIKTTSGKVIPKEDLIHLMFINANYVAMLEAISTTFAVNPFLLEYMLNLQGDKFSTIRKNIKQVDRYLDLEERNGSIVLTGLYDDKIHTVIFNEFLYDNCKGIKQFLDASPEEYFNVNGTNISLYGLMKMYDSYRPSSIQRFKGLGEMDPNQLKESTLHPDYNRHLIRFTTADIEKEIQAIRKIESNKSLLLKGVNFAGYDI